MTNTYKSAADWFRHANCKTVRKIVTGAKTVTDWPDMVQQAQWDCDKNNLTMTVTDNLVQISNGQFLMKPALVANETGTFKVRSSDYSFTPLSRLSDAIFGDKKGVKVNEAGQLVKTYDNGMIVTFEILE